MSVPEAQGPAQNPFEVLRTWRSAAAVWRDRISMLPAVGSQPTKVYIDLSHLPGVEITTFHPIQTDPAPAHALFALDNNPSATQAFALIATVLAESTEALATQIELVGIDSGKAHLFAAALRDQPVLVTTEHLPLFEETELLGRRLDAKLKGLAQVATTEFVTMPPAADARPTPVAPSDFYELALGTLDDAKSLIVFRRLRPAHPEWEALSRTIPPHLVAATDEWEDAKSAASLANHEHEQALAGMFYNEWIVPSHRDRQATVRALADRAEHAEVRRAEAARLVDETQHDRSVAETAVAEQWLQSRAAAFRARFAAYEAALDQRVQVIESTRSSAYVLRGWKESCACAVLREIGSVLLQVLDPIERETDWWGTLCLGERFDDLDHDAWRDLRIDLRQEAAKARQLPGSADMPTSAVQAAPAERTANSDTPAWPPPQHATIVWANLSPIERDQVSVFVEAGPKAVLEVPLIALRARGREPNRHDWEAAQNLEDMGLLESVGSTGRRLVAVPRDMPPPKGAPKVQ